MNSVNRVLRGGSWINNGRNCRSAIRNHNTAGNGNRNNGFRFSLAQYLIGRQVNDQIIIPPCRLSASKKQGDPRVSSKSESSWDYRPEVN